MIFKITFLQNRLKNQKKKEKKSKAHKYLLINLSIYSY